MSASHLRTLLILGRVSNLPTVWSNCFAAWTLAGGGVAPRLALVLASGSCFYVGGMFLNDACDAEFDRQHRPERPIPTGLMSRSAVWAWGSGILLAGALLAVPLGGRALACALALLAAIVAYDFWHKRHPAALGLMAGCRLLLYLFAGIAAAGTAPPQVLTVAAGMAAYIMGISLLARHESGANRPPTWPLFLLAAPIATAGLNAFAATVGATAIALALFLVWLAAALLPLWQARPKTGRAVGRLLAGIVFADCLQVAAMAPSWAHAALFAALFGLTLLLQRRVPAT
jgi:4-hydroxybenzoate polyprenyltransferase